MRIIRRSFEITWVYKALWIFGFILALTTGGGGSGGGGGGGGGGGSYLPSKAAAVAWRPPLLPQQPPAVVFLIVTLLVFGILLALIFTALRVIAETALIRMVDLYEETGVRIRASDGFRLGWSPAAWRIFLIDLLVIGGSVLVILLIMAVAFAPMLVLGTDNRGVTPAAPGLSIALFVPGILLTIAIITVILVLLQFFHRAAVLEEHGVLDSIRRGWAVMRMRTWDAVLMAALLFGIGLAFAFLILPVLLLLLLIGVVAGGIPALLAGLIAYAVASSETAWLFGLVIGLPVFLAVVILPILFLSGLLQVYNSSAWTLTYREIMTLEAARG